MFQRRVQRTALQNLKEIFWPTMGWIRAVKYTKHRIVRLSDSSHKIALGLAFGAAISFTPLVGTHFIQAGILAYLFRANMVASLVGTFVGNPWTFPFMWWSAIAFGSFLFGIVGLPAETALPDEVNFRVVFDLFKNEPLRIFGPWFLGGYLIALLSLLVSYPLFLNLVRGAKLARMKARQRRLHKEAKTLTGQKK